MDFSKAFDTLDHAILVSKLNHYGIRGIALDWIKSYMLNRKQYVLYNNNPSDVRTIYNMWGPTRVNTWLLVISDICE